VQHVPLLVAERSLQLTSFSHEDDAAAFLHAEPLVGIEGRRVGTVEADEERRHGWRRCPWEPVGTVDVQPRAVARAYVGDRVERIYGPRERRARCRHHGHGQNAGGDVGGERLVERLRSHPAAAVDGDVADGGASQSADLDGADHRVVCLLRAVHRRPAASDSVHAGSGQCPLTRREQRCEVRRHTAARERAFRERETDELRDPAQGLLLDKICPAGSDGEVHVVGGRERGGQYAYLQAG
jgi:hypothetical protein